MAKAFADLDTIHHSLKTLLQELESVSGSTLQGRSVSNQDFDLWSVRDLVIDGRNRQELFFAGIRRQKACVAFYYFPLYVLPSLAASLGPPLVKLLKGKTCFHLKTLDGDLLVQIREALNLGIMNYRERGWA
jgi:hypothetical protein